MTRNLLYKLPEEYNKNIFRVGFYTGLLVLLFLFAYRFLLIFTYNPEIGGIDNNFVYGVIRNMAGYDIYPDPEKLPYAVNSYSPLYFILCSTVGHLFNISIDEPVNIYRLCRSVSFFCDVCTSLLFFRTIVRTGTLKKEVAVFITSVFACILCNIGYTFSRPDSLFLLFYAATFYTLIASSVKSSIIKTTLLALLTTACIFSKQNGIILPLLISIWIWMNDSLRKMLLYTGIFIIFFTGFFCFFNYWSGYSHFTSHIIDALKNKIDFSWFYAYVFKRFADSLILLPVYLAACISFIHFKKGTGKEKALGLVFLIQVLFSLGASLKWGATPSYFNESFFLGLIIIAQYISANDRMPGNIFSKKILSWLLPVFILFSFHTCVQGYLFFLQNQKMKKEMYEKQVAVRDYLLPRLDGTYVLNLGNQNGDFFKTLFYKNAAVPNYDAVSCCTLPDKTFDYSGLLNDLQKGKIGWLLMQEQDLITEQWGISLGHFKKDTSINGYVIYKFQNQ